MSWLGPLGPLAEAIKEIFVWSTSEGGRIESAKRRALRDARNDAYDALETQDLHRLKSAVARLERLSNQP